jgi:dTDP-4-dehydrorhamnose reductase
MGGSVHVRPIATAEANRPARRPAYAVLGNHVLAQRGVTLPHWKDALTRFIEEVRIRRSKFDVEVDNVESRTSNR